MNPIKELPAWDWTEHARKEIIVSGPDLLTQSDFAWEVGGVAICGLIYNNYCAPPWMWFAIRKGVELRHLLDFRRYAEFIPKGTTTAVLEDFDTGIRFAQLYGFIPTKLVIPHGDQFYIVFRRD